MWLVRKKELSGIDPHFLVRRTKWTVLSLVGIKTRKETTLQGEIKSYLGCAEFEGQIRHTATGAG